MNDDQRLRQALHIPVPREDAVFLAAVMLRVGRRSVLIKASERILAVAALTAAATTLTPLFSDGPSLLSAPTMLIAATGLAACFATGSILRQLGWR